MPARMLRACWRDPNLRQLPRLGPVAAQRAIRHVVVRNEQVHHALALAEGIVLSLDQHRRFNDPGDFCTGMGAFCPIYD